MDRYLLKPNLFTYKMLSIRYLIILFFKVAIFLKSPQTDLQKARLVMCLKSKPYIIIATVKQI